MTSSKKYFHDRLVLLLLSVNAFLTVAAIAWILLRLSSAHGNGLFSQFRANLGVNSFKTGTSADILAFTLFALIVLAVHSFLSFKTFHIHRQLSVTILTLGTILLLLTIIVSNALLVLR